MNEEEDATILELEFPCEPVNIHHSLSIKARRETLSKRKSIIAKESRLTVTKIHGLESLWNGEWKDAEVQLGITKSRDAHSAFRWALIPLFKYVLSQNDALLEEIVSRFQFAETTCSKALSALEMDEETNFIKKRFGFIMVFGMKSNLNNKEKDTIDERNGIHARMVFSMLVRGIVCYMQSRTIQSLFLFRRAWNQLQNESKFHKLSLGLIYIVLGKLPMWIQRLVGVKFSIRSGIEFLEAVPEELYEERHLADLLRVYQLMQMSSSDYRKDKTLKMKKAHQIVSLVLSKHPRWTMYRLANSHLLRRLGKVQESAAFLDNSECSKFNLAIVAFVSRSWTQCENLLKGSKDGNAILLMAASIAMRGNIIESVTYLDNCKAPAAWTKKIEILKYRPHKNTLYYELCYLFGVFKWFDIEVSGTLKVGGQQASEQWLKVAEKELMDMHNVANIAVIYSDSINTKDEAAEELLTVSHLCGCIASMQGDLKMAASFYQFVLDNYSSPNFKKGAYNDPWHEPFALFELGCLRIRTLQPLIAKEYLQRCLKKRNFLFAPQLNILGNEALRFVTNQCVSDADWTVKNDVLGSWITGMGDFHNEMQDQSQVVNVTIKPETVHVVRKAIDINQTITWSWGVESGDMGFEIKINNSLQQSETIAPHSLCETGDLNEGFYTSQIKGELVFTWSNMHSKHMERVVFFTII